MLDGPVGKFKFITKLFQTVNFDVHDWTITR